MNTDIQPRIVRSIIGAQDLIRERLTRLVRKAGYGLYELMIETREACIVIALEIEDTRVKSQIHQFCFSPVKNLLITGVSSLGDRSGNEFVYDAKTCTVDDVMKVVEQRLYRYLSGFRRERLALHYFLKLSRTVPEIRSVRLSTKMEDRQGVDIVVDAVFNGKRGLIPIQIKSTVPDQNIHMQNTRTRRIPSVVVLSRLHYDQLSPRMIDLLRSYVIDGKSQHITHKKSLSRTSS